MAAKTKATPRRQYQKVSKIEQARQYVTTLTDEQLNLPIKKLMAMAHKNKVPKMADTTWSSIRVKERSKRAGGSNGAVVGSDVLSQLTDVKRMADKFGGLGNLKRLIITLEKLQ